MKAKPKNQIETMYNNIKVITQKKKKKTDQITYVNSYHLHIYTQKP